MWSDFLPRSVKRALAAGTVACLLSSAGLAAPVASLAHNGQSKITLTEEDYWAFANVSNAINGLITQYEKLNPNVTIQRTIISTNLPTKLLAQSATNSVPSIVMSGPEAMPAMIAANVLVPITSQIQAWGQWGQYLKSSQTNTSWQGQIYGIAIGANDLGLFYNEDMFKAAGITTPPATWSDLSAYQPFDRLPLVHFGFWVQTLEKWYRERHLTLEEVEGWVHGDAYNPYDRTVSAKLGFDYNWYSCFAADASLLHPRFEGKLVEEGPDGMRKVLNDEGVIVLQKAGAISIPTEVDHRLKDRES